MLYGPLNSSFCDIIYASLCYYCYEDTFFVNDVFILFLLQIEDPHIIEPFKAQ
jgi:hypothetical protein